MDINIIKHRIEALEVSGSTLEEAQELACLYIIVDNFDKTEERIINEAVDRVTEELHDILPQYRRYKEVKREYQINKIGKELVQETLKDVCRELSEFILALYTNTNSEEERKLIKSSLMSTVNKI